MERNIRNVCNFNNLHNFISNISPFQLSDIVFELFSSNSQNHLIGYARVRGEDVLTGEIDDIYQIQKDEKDT